MNSNELAIRQIAQLTPTNKGRSYGDVQIAGNAVVQLGDRYGSNKDLFEEGSETENRYALLNVLYYEGLDLRREQLALTDIGPRSFSWIEHTSFPHWLTSSDTRFWINGKPGSGKSTLMKHLAESRLTLTRLGTDGKQWTVVHFFFDYRAGKSMANRVLGMLKLFLRQLSLSVKQIREQLQEPALQQRLTEEKIEGYMDILSLIITSAGVEVCAFIDGLDEYDDDLWDLCARLDELRHRTGMKMCLASRPERAFEDSFADCPIITMQEHNKTSIEVYMHRKIQKFHSQHPFIEDLFPDDLLDAVVEKAQGVILWARLVVDEMIKSCDDDTTTASLLSFLDTMPSELEPLYERILGKINMKYQNEAALVLHILVENDGTMKAATLFQAWDFLRTHIMHTAKPTNSFDFTASQARVKALLGNMVDLVRPSRKALSIRLVHKSLSTYLGREDWIARHLPETLKQKYPDHFGRRLAFDCIDLASKHADMNMQELESLFRERTRPVPIGLNFSQAAQFERESSGAGYSTGVGNNFKSQWIESPEWSKWGDFLLHCFDGIFDELDPLQNSDRQSSHMQLFWPSGASNIALMHYMRCMRCLQQNGSHWHKNLALRLYHARALDVLLLLVHNCGPLAWSRIFERLSQVPRATIVDIFDLCVLHGAPILDYGGDANLFLLFSERTLFVEARHLCYALGKHRRGCLTGMIPVLKAAARKRPKGQAVVGHHVYCPYVHTQTTVLHHWLYARPENVEDADVAEQFDILELAKDLGVDINRPYSKSVSSLYHAVLYLMNDPFYEQLDEIRAKFIALAKAGARLIFRGGRKNLLHTTKAQLIQLRESRQKELARTPIQRRRTEWWYDSREAFLTQVLAAIEHYKVNDRQWPDLEQCLQVFKTPPSEHEHSFQYFFRGSRGEI